MSDVLVKAEGKATISPEVSYAPMVEGEKSFHDVTSDIINVLQRRPGALWWVGFILAALALAIGVIATAYTIRTGIGTWGLNNTVGWAFDITNFVFWIGIGHAGTLISAILFLLRQRWRTSVNRAAEAMTIFAVICAGLFPVIHMGRPWLFFWMIPYPNTRGSLWINFRSPLVWDFFAILTYFSISLVFWYIGMIPDLATVRDHGRSKFKRWVAGTLSLGWDGSARTWQRYEALYLLLAGLATPLVLSVHTIVSWDFSTSVIPGWHTTIFPPYFVAGAIFSGMAMVLTLMIIARSTLKLQDYITLNHLDAMGKILLLTSGMVGIAYTTEFFTALYSGNLYESFIFLNRALGPLGWSYGVMVLCNVVVPQSLWIRPIRRNPLILFFISLVVNMGMWFERFVIIVSSLYRDYLISSWADYHPTVIEFAILLGSFGLFFTCFFLFIRFVPVIAISEVKGALKERWIKFFNH